jgi:hypothetical protein
MLKFIMAAVAATSITVPVVAQNVRGWKTLDSMGCMMMRECLEDTWDIKSTSDIEALVSGVNYDSVREETDGLITELNKMGVNFYLAADKYFPRGHAGVYYTVGNDFFLNRSYADQPDTMIRTLRHEAWHAAQDAMAGTIDNNNIAIIRAEEDVPARYRVSAEAAYGPNNPALPWEKEAKWAGGTPGMTLEVLRTINETNGRPWEVIEPTPLTRLWLERNGYIN